MIFKSNAPTSAMTASTRRKLVVAILAATLLTLTLLIADLASGGRPDPPALRAAAILLDGPWQFRTGDDPHWAHAGIDDQGWETIDLTAAPGSHDGDVGLPDYVAGWMAHGHAGYHGFAWYRRALTVPPGDASWDLLGPTLVEDGYEIYWNGQLLGGSGNLGPDPRVVGTRPLRFALPADAAGSRGVLSVRAYKLPGSASEEGGGMHSAPILAPRPIADALHRVQWQRTIAGYIVDVVEPIALFALIGLALWCRPRSNRQAFLILASAALALMATRRLTNATVAWTDLMDLRTYTWLASVMWIPTVAAWVFAWNRWCERPRYSVDVSAAVLAIVAIVGVVADSAIVTRASRIGSILLFVVIAARLLRSESLRVLALVTMAAIVAGLFGGELLDTIGVPGIWFPFGIGVSRTQYVYAITIPLMAFLIVQVANFSNQPPAARQGHD